MFNYSGFVLMCLLFASCMHSSDAVSEKMPALYEKPVTYQLDTLKGYDINPLSGDSVKPLIHAQGDTVKTGISFSLEGRKVEMPALKKPKSIMVHLTPGIRIKNNQQKWQQKPLVITAKSHTLEVKNLAAGKDSICINPSAYIILNRKELTVTRKKILKHPPLPVKVQAMRYKDNAVLDIQYLDIGQGLNFSYIYDLYQDKNGYLWMATDYGLSKYDGTYLTTYTEKEGLPDNRVISISSDKEGRLWIGTYKGLCLFDGNEFIKFEDKEGCLSGYLANATSSINGDMWFSLDDSGLVKYANNSFYLYTSTDNINDGNTPKLVADNMGNLWLAAPDGIIKFDGEKYSYLNPGASMFQKVNAIVADSKGNTWFGLQLNGITSYKNDTFIHYDNHSGLSDPRIISIMIDKKDNVWIGTRYEGLCKFDGAGFTTFNKELGLSENKIGCTLEDKQGNIWVGTIGGGINKINDNGFEEKIALSHFDNSRVRPIVKDKFGQLWFGTERAGVYSFDGTYLYKQLNESVSNFEGFRSAMVDREKNLWFGQQNGTGFYRYDYKQFYYYLPHSLNSSLLSLYQDKTGIIWMGTSKDGIVAYNGNELIYYDESVGFSNNKVFATIQDKKNNIWMGTDAGLVKYDGKLFTVYTEKQGLFGKSVSSLLEDEDGNIWLGTLDAGLCRFDGNSFTYYGEKQGLAFRAIWSLKEDAYRRIWVGTDNGLTLLDPQKKSDTLKAKGYKIFSFGLQDGLKATDFNLNSVCIDDNNRIWWGTGKALITRDLSVAFQPGTPESLNLIDIKINDQHPYYWNASDSLKEKIQFSPIQSTQAFPSQLSLAYDQNHLTFYYSAIEWKAPHKLKYSYRLLGFDNKWSNPSRETSVDYRNLPHGDYELQIRAIGESQQWTAPFKYSFIIRPAWWQTWWFKLLMIITAASVLLFISRQIYLIRLRKQKALLEKQLAVQIERQRISSEMHDDIGAGLSGVRLLTELTKNKLKDAATISEMDKIYQSIGDISAKMKEAIWSLNTENDSLNSLLHYIQKQSKQIMELYPAKLVITMPENIPEVTISGDVRRHIYLSVKEALHNIIKHSDADTVEINMVCKDKLEITIKDNGKGMVASTHIDTGNGLKNMHKRMDAIGGRLTILNEKGITLIFTIPINL